MVILRSWTDQSCRTSQKFLRNEFVLRPWEPNLGRFANRAFRLFIFIFQQIRATGLLYFVLQFVMTSMYGIWMVRFQSWADRSYLSLHLQIGNTARLEHERSVQRNLNDAIHCADDPGPFPVDPGTVGIILLTCVLDLVLYDSIHRSGSSFEDTYHLLNQNPHCNLQINSKSRTQSSLKASTKLHCGIGILTTYVTEQRHLLRPFS